MNDSTHPPNQFSSPMNSDIPRIRIPDFGTPVLPTQQNLVAKMVDENADRIDAVQKAIGNSINGTNRSTPTKIDGLIDSILVKFPLGNPVTLTFVSCKTDAETDTVAAAVARRLTERRIGKVLLIDANPNSQRLSSDLHLAKSEGIGNVICADQPWKAVLQSGQINGLDFLPYGNTNTAKTLRSNTLNFLTNAKLDYQFVCVSAGRNDSPISKSFCVAADGIYLLVDLIELTHLEAKAAADKYLLNNLPLVGCIALDAEQDQQ